jgi:D-threo-aldose 1-dehydrogenase
MGVPTVALGRSGLRVSALALGTAPLGNLFAPVAEEDAAATIRAALAAGLTYVDTAPHYGLGLAERRVGRVLAEWRRDGVARGPGGTRAAAPPAVARGSGGMRGSAPPGPAAGVLGGMRGAAPPAIVVSTKVGRLVRSLTPGETVDPEGFAGEPPGKRVWDFSRDGVRRSLEESLERLGLDRVGIVLVHDPDDHEREAYEQAFPALTELRDQGAVRAIGAGMNQAEMLTRFVRDLDLDLVLVAGRYSLLDQRALAELLPTCAARGTAVVVGGVFNSGLLADPRPGATFDYAPAPPELVDRAVRLAEACARHGVPLRTAALAFPFGHPAVTSVLVGARSAAEVEDAVAAFERPVPGELWAELVATGLLPDHVPTPAGPR